MYVYFVNLFVKYSYNPNQTSTVKVSMLKKQDS